MENLDSISRRDFFRNAGLGTGLVLGAASMAPALRAAEPVDNDITPDAVLKKLMEGNQRFIDGKLSHPGRKPEDFLALAAGQAPPAVIVSCADSRVPPEIIFDQGIGELFVVRVAGNVVANAGPLVKGSIEFAVAELGARLILVMGHTECGAVKAAIEFLEADDVLPGAIGQLIDPIRPAVRASQGKPGNKLENVTKANVMAGVERLKTLDPIVSKAVQGGTVGVYGGVYHLDSGKVEIFS